MSFTNLANSGRFSVSKLGNLESNDQFWLQSADELIEGLKRNQKFIPIEFLYDDLGSELFDKMVDSEEYYLPHKEKEILKKFGSKIVELTKECDIYELGSGSAKKTSILLRCYRDAGYSFTFYPIDINQSIMEKGAGELNNILPDIPINCIVGTFEQALTEMKVEKNKRMVLFIGSSISQLRNDDLIHLLYTVLEPGEFVLVGYDLYKNPEILKAAYQNNEVQNANKNALSCINKYFDGNFELKKFDFIVIYNSNEQRCETHLRSLTDHVVHIKHLELTLELKSGETICTGYQRKFTIAEVQSRFAKAGFKDVEAFTDDHNWYAMTLFQANHADRNLGR